MEEFFSTYKNKLLVLFVLFIIVLVLLILQFITNSGGRNKIVTNKDYVFVEKELPLNNEIKNEVPFINVKADNIEDVNDDIISFVYEETITYKRNVSYEYYKNDDILSLLLISKEYLTNGLVAFVKYKSYNIDLNQNKVLTNDEVLEKYNMDEYYIYDLEQAKMKKYFEEAVKEGYTDGYADFSNYTYYHEPDIFNESYYIKEDGLYYYKDFLLASVLGDERFFQDKDLFVKIEK